MSAVEAAVAVAADHGLRSDQPVVLSEAWHVLVHLRPFPVVARVTSGAAGVDPGDVERELAVAGHAAARGRAGRPAERPASAWPASPGRAHARLLALPRAGGRARPGRRRPRAPPDPRLACGLRRRASPRRPRGGGARDAGAASRPRMTSSSSASWPRASCPRGRRCTAMPTSSTASRPRPVLSGTTWRPRAAARANTTLPRSSWTTARTGPDPAARAAIAAYGPYDEDVLEQAIPVYASWVAASFMVAVARRPELRRHSSASCGFCAASAVRLGGTLEAPLAVSSSGRAIPPADRLARSSNCAGLRSGRAAEGARRQRPPRLIQRTVSRARESRRRAGR